MSGVGRWLARGRLDFVALLLLLELAACAGEPLAPAEALAQAGQLRTMSNVQETFDRNKLALVSVYNHRIRNDAHLKSLGAIELKFRFTIDASGAITDCAVLSDTADNPELESQLLDVIRHLRFTPAVAPFSYDGYPIAFMPMPVN